MSTTQHHDADRETLSALFDGELQGDAARFALKRLDHDVKWRDTCGRWQLAADALRGHASAPAPTGFADRVGAALADEKAAGASANAVVGAVPMRRRWIGGAALAASVAVAALFVVQPFSGSSDPASPAAQIAATGQPAAPSTENDRVIAGQSPAAQSPTPQATPRIPAVGIGLAAAAVAVADAPRRGGERRSRDQSRRPAVVASQRRVDAPVTVAAAAPATATPSAIASNIDAAPTMIEPSPTHPFLPQGEIASRPWPRAVLPDYPVGGAFTASFDSGADARGASFYPFEPRMLEAGLSESAAPAGSDWPRR